MPETLSPGQTVLYTLSANEADALAEAHADKIGRTLNRPEAGQVCAALVLRVWSPTCANLKVFLDGEPTYWATSRSEGEGEGRWSIWARPTMASASDEV